MTKNFLTKCKPTITYYDFYHNVLQPQDDYVHLYMENNYLDSLKGKEVFLNQLLHSIILYDMEIEFENFNKEKYIDNLDPKSVYWNRYFLLEKFTFIKKVKYETISSNVYKNVYFFEGENINFYVLCLSGQLTEIDTFCTKYILRCRCF